MRRWLLWLAVPAAALCGPAVALAKPAAITGKLSKPGYTVIALGYNGKAVSSSARSFRLVPRDTKVTLQLRNAKGKYAGPVVVGGKGSSVIVGVKAGAKLGTIKILSGYGKASKAKGVDKRRTAQARKGVPLGNGRNFGLVRSKKHATAGAGRDGDLDGVPDALDVDSNGNLVLNNEEAAGRSARAAQTENGFQLFSQIGAPLERSLNANGGGVSDAAIDALVQGSTSPPTFQPIGVFLDFSIVPGDQVELDCGGLSYCSKGGTGRERTPGRLRPGPELPRLLRPGRRRLRHDDRHPGAERPAGDADLPAGHGGADQLGRRADRALHHERRRDRHAEHAAGDNSAQQVFFRRASRSLALSPSR